ncbi:MAG: DUF2155 domain-containing protein [Xanthobacteraceae bacterium]
MARALLITLLVAGSAMLGSAPAGAQFNPFEALFGSPPRPPSSVPGGRVSPQGYPQYPEQQDPRYQDPRYQDPRYQDPRYRDPRAQDYPDQQYPSQPGVPRPGPTGVQSQPLPPPPGGATAAVPPGQALEPLPPVQRPRGTPQPADTSPQGDDEVIPELPSQKIPNKAALFSGLDKITGRIINFDVAIGETVQFGALQVTARTCYTRPPTETANTDGFIEVDEVTLQGEVKRIFTGWMFATSPGLHAVEHPIYDVWLTDCKNPVVAAASPPEPAPASALPAKPPAAAQRRPAQQQPAPAPPRR